MQLVFRLAKGQRSPIGKQPRREDPVFNPCNLQCRSGPVKYVHIDGLIVCSGAQTCNALHWPVGSAVNRVAIQREPIAYCAEPLLKLRLNLTIRLWPHIQ